MKVLEYKFCVHFDEDIIPSSSFLWYLNFFLWLLCRIFFFFFWMKGKCKRYFPSYFCALRDPFPAPGPWTKMLGFSLHLLSASEFGAVLNPGWGILKGKKWLIHCQFSGTLNSGLLQSTYTCLLWVFKLFFMYPVHVL